MQKYFYNGGPVSFVGLQYDQLITKSLTSVQVDYSYRIRKKFFAKLIANYALNFQHLAQQSQSQAIFQGYGLALQYNSFNGPAILTVANGPESVLRDTGRQTVGYFTVGYRF